MFELRGPRTAFKFQIAQNLQTNQTGEGCSTCSLSVNLLHTDGLALTVNAVRYWPSAVPKVTVSRS